MEYWEKFAVPEIGSLEQRKIEKRVGRSWERYRGFNNRLNLFLFSKLKSKILKMTVRGLKALLKAKFK